MRRFLICGGLYGHEKGLPRLQRAVEEWRPDGLLFVGGVLSLRRHYAPRLTAWDMTSEDALTIHRFLEAVGRLGIFAAVIPGPLDTPLEEFLHMGMHAELEFPSLHIVHAVPAVKGEVVVYGLGGPLCEGPACECDATSRTMAEYYLRHMPEARQSRKVLLLSEPARNVVDKGCGSDLIGDLIRSYHPGLCVVAGPTSQAGSQRWATTLVVNPGYLADGSAVLVDWDRPVAEQVEILDLGNHGAVTACDTGGGD